MIKICKKCFYHEFHPLNITFSNDICSGCSVHEEKYKIRWNDRLKKLKDIIKPYKNDKKNTYDCIVPVSGARDSYFIVHFIKKILRLNPLLVSYNIQYNSKIGLRNTAHIKNTFGCAHLVKTVDPKIVKKITHNTLKKFGSIYWHCIAGQTAYPVQVAVNFNIPLIIWGAHQGLDQVGMHSHDDYVEMSRRYRKNHDLMGYEAEDISKISNINLKDLEAYKYPEDKHIQNLGIKGIYLNNYIFWDSRKQNELMIKKYNYKTEKIKRTFDPYQNIDCNHYSGLHDYLKLIKHGYSLVTDNVNREIRLKRLNKIIGANIINKYQNQKINDLPLFLKWLEIDRKSIQYIFDKFRNQKYWKKDSNKWKLKNFHQKYQNKESILQNNKFENTFKINKHNLKEKKKENQLFDKGWEEENDL